MPVLCLGNGDLIEGHIRVPLRLVGTKQHTNERLEFERYLAEQVKRWVDWRLTIGWELNSTPQVKGPFNPPIDNPQAEVPDWKEYHVTAYFKPTTPQFIGLEDAYQLRVNAERYGVDLWAPKPVSSLVEQQTKDVIYDNRPWHNPLVDAEQRRQKYRIKREELLLGPLSEPLKPPD